MPSKQVTQLEIASLQVRQVESQAIHKFEPGIEVNPSGHVVRHSLLWRTFPETQLVQVVIVPEQVPQLIEQSTHVFST
jgi:hypothetical protein